MSGRWITPHVYRSPGHIALHIWWPGKLSIVIGDRTMGIRAVIVVRGFAIWQWRS